MLGFIWKKYPENFLFCNPVNSPVIYPGSLYFSLKEGNFLTYSIVFVCLQWEIFELIFLCEDGDIFRY